MLATQNAISHLFSCSKSKNKSQKCSASFISSITGILITILSILIADFNENLIELAIKILSYAGSPVSAVLLFSMFDKRRLNAFLIMLAFIITAILSFSLLYSAV